MTNISVFLVAVMFLTFAVSSTTANTVVGCHGGGLDKVVTSDIQKGISFLRSRPGIPDPYPLEGLGGGGVGMIVSNSATFSLQSLTFFDHDIPLKDIVTAAQDIMNSCCGGATCTGGSAHVPGYMALVEISF